MQKLLFSLLVLLPVTLFAQKSSTYIRHEAMIPMRDGKRLYTIYYTPPSFKNDLPFILSRTPYSSDSLGPPDTSAYTSDMAAGGYIFV